MTRDFSGTSEIVRFDWYSGSLIDDVPSDEVVLRLARDLDAVPSAAHPRQGYGSAVELKRGQELAGVVMWGGQHERCFVQGSGADAVGVAQTMRREWLHAVSRIDACIDWNCAGAWESVSGETLAVARARGLTKRQAGDWLDPHQKPGQGRTLYVGSPSSAVQLRVYEKGRQLPEAQRPDWTRAEVQGRPKREGRLRMAQMSPSEVWGASAWTGELFERLTGDSVPPARLEVWRPSDPGRAYEWMLRSYRATLERLAESYGWAEVGPVIRDDLKRLVAGEQL